MTLRVQVPNYRILSQIVTYITTILKPSTIGSFGPLGLFSILSSGSCGSSRFAGFSKPVSECFWILCGFQRANPI